MVESTIKYSKSGSSDIASKMRHQTPLMLHRLKRRNTLFQSPNASGRSRQGEPVRTIHKTPSTNIRLSRPVEPFWSGRPMISGAIRSQAASLKTKRSITPKAASTKAALNHASSQMGILRVHTALEGLRGEENISELGRREGIAASMYYGWSKEFLEAGKRRLAGDTARAATSGEVKDLRREASALKEVVADLTLENRLLKKSMSGDGEDEA